MRHPLRKTVLSAFIVLYALMPLASHARQGAKYIVTITNLTRGQVITPPIVITHNDHFSLFQPGDEASPELTALAEEGNTEPLESLLGTAPSVANVVAADAPLFPGESTTLMINGHRGSYLLTVAGMLASSNDAFFAVRGARVLFGEKTMYANAYDAGTEKNTESCLHVPGPPCGSTGVRFPEGAEGFVHIHGGIHGGKGLDPAEHDWRNPVVAVTIKRFP